MQPTWGTEAEQYRQKVQAFLAEQLPADWKGIGALRSEEFAKAGVPTGGPNDAFSIQMVGNTFLQWGSEGQKREFIPKILSGDHRWCQGYSEPNAGSDLGNLGCRATLDGEEWVINGQKIWTSAGHLANWIFVLARTDVDAPEHRGITFLLAPMDQPGVEVRPIEMINGDSEFNEVFFSDARCAKDNVIGGVNNGWAVAMTLLGGVGTFLTARAGTIHAGSSEIQRNIVGEMVLGLPKEPRPEGAGASWKAQQQRS